MTGLTLFAGHPKALWYLTRGTGTVALLLLTGSVLLGVASCVRLHGNRLPRFVVSGLHRNLTLLAVAFVVVHIATTIIDGFAPIGLKDAIVPFLSSYRPLWLGLGAVAFDLLVALIVTSLLRAHIGARAWRALHWLAYAAWPVGLVHALGTGSDVGSSWWLPALAGLCASAVSAAILWRIASAPRGARVVRAGASLAAVAVPIAIVVWALSGPLRPGWARRAGTPAQLLASTRQVPRPVAAPATRRTPVSPQPAPSPEAGTHTVLRTPFDATLSGTIREASVGDGLVVVRIDASTRGGFRGRVHVALRGVPLGGGGVRMLNSSAGLLPDGAPVWYAGRVVALEGQQILADVEGPNGKTVRLLLRLQIAFGARRVSGSVQGVPANVDPGLAA